VFVVWDEGGSPHANLAVEEAMLETVGGWGGFVVRVWINRESVVIGYTLDPCLEVDCGEASRLGVPVVRRLTGGGAVYHDRGNVNLSLFMPGRMGVGEAYYLGTRVVLGALERFGLRGWVENTNDVVVGGWKVSGSAASVKANATLFHATLLVEADMDRLRRLVKPRLDRVERGEVTPAKYNPANISSLKPGVTVEDARLALTISALETLGFKAAPLNAGCPGLLGRVAGRARVLYESKYSTPHWSPVGPRWWELPESKCYGAMVTS